MAHKDILEELKDGIQTGRIPLITNPYVDEETKEEYRKPFIKALDAGISALDKQQNEP